MLAPLFDLARLPSDVVQLGKANPPNRNLESASKSSLQSSRTIGQSWQLSKVATNSRTFPREVQAQGPHSASAAPLPGGGGIHVMGISARKNADLQRTL